MDDLAEVLLITFVCQALQWQLDDLMEGVESLLVAHIREQQPLNRALPDEKNRTTWDVFCSRISVTHFRRIFRMPIDAFTSLCKKIEAATGEEKFRSESYLESLEVEKKDAMFEDWYSFDEEGDEGERTKKKRKIPPIAGEIKVAVSIRFLAGGSYLDLVPLFGVSKSSLYIIFGVFLDWILLVLEFPLVRWLKEENWSALKALADQFGEKTNGVFWGPFASLDGLAVRVRSPKLSEVPDPSNYYCRKGFYALNVQGMCDRTKRYLWLCPSNKGSTHDSSAFGGSQLYDLLLEKADQLYEKGLFIVGDSAYGLAPFLLVPYDMEELQDDREKAKDSFNFHLSSRRIYIECSFGELVMRWGTLWGTLQYSLRKSAKTLQVCCLLHNWIVDAREGKIPDDLEKSYFSQFDIQMDTVQRHLTEQTEEMPVALATDNN